MKHVELEAKISGPETVSLEELVLGFLETLQEDTSEGAFAAMSYWDVIHFFVRYLNEHGYGVLQYAKRQKLSTLPPELKNRCERFYAPDWRERAKKSYSLPPAGLKGKIPS